MTVALGKGASVNRMEPILDVVIKMTGVSGVASEERDVYKYEREHVWLVECVLAGTLYRDAWVYASVAGEEVVW